MSRGEQEAALRDIIAKGWEIPGSTRSLVARSTVLRWVALYEKSGRRIESLEPQPRKDRGTSRALGAELEAALVLLRKEHAAVSFPVFVKLTRSRKILRAAADRLHPSQYRVISLVATSGSLMELLRQICIASGDPPTSNSIAKMVALVRSLLMDIAGKKQTPVLIVDEAHLLRLDVFDQLHTVAQADFDSRTLVPIVLSGQTSLIDKLLFHTSKPFASRIVGRNHMEALQRDHMAEYLAHHVAIAGGTKPLFSADAVTAIHQSSGSLLRRAGHLARGALMAAAREQCPIATAEHVRIAATEIL